MSGWVGQYSHVADTGISMRLGSRKMIQGGFPYLHIVVGVIHMYAFMTFSKGLFNNYKQFKTNVIMTFSNFHQMYLNKVFLCQVIGVWICKKTYMPI